MNHVSWRQFTRDPKLRSQVIEKGECIVVEEVKGKGALFVSPFYLPSGNHKQSAKPSWVGCLKEYDDGEDDLRKLWDDSLDD